MSTHRAPWLREYQPERDLGKESEVPAEAIARRDLRHRIEDVSEGIRLERECFAEVWDV